VLFHVNDVAESGNTYISTIPRLIWLYYSVCFERTMTRFVERSSLAVRLVFMCELRTYK